MSNYAQPLTDMVPSGGDAGTFWAPRTIEGVTFYHAAQDYFSEKPAMSPVVKAPCLVNEWNKQLGWYVRQGDRTGEIFQYAHLRYQATVPVGAMMEPGVVFGEMGNTGFSFGAHLHLTQSYRTETQAIAAGMAMGHTEALVRANITTRLDSVFINPVLFIGIEEPPEEDEMELFIIFKTNEGPQFRYLPDEGKFLELTNAELRCMEDAVAQKVATISRSTGSYQEAVDSGIKK